MKSVQGVRADRMKSIQGRIRANMASRWDPFRVRMTLNEANVRSTGGHQEVYLSSKRGQFLAKMRLVLGQLQVTLALI